MISVEYQRWTHVVVWSCNYLVDPSVGEQRDDDGREEGNIARKAHDAVTDLSGGGGEGGEGVGRGGGGVSGDTRGLARAAAKVGR